MTSKTVHFDLVLIDPSFGSDLTQLTVELEKLRHLPIRRTTPKYIFRDLKSIVHIMESIGSARIEGNNTTVLDYVDAKAEQQETATEPFREISNIENALKYLEENVAPGQDITHHLIRELHLKTVEGLRAEGDKTPGAYRQADVKINGSHHIPPTWASVQSYMDELLAFTNAADKKQYDFIKVSLAHHRFAWIHPFSNGNGRVVRLLTYAILIRAGFDLVSGGRVFNPTAVFCIDRDKYYAKLAAADTGTKEGLEEWCTYVLSGFKDSLEKINQLADFDYFKSQIYEPALKKAHERESLTQHEYQILAHAPIKENSFKRDDIVKSTRLDNNQVTYVLKNLKRDNVIVPMFEGSRQYRVNFSGNKLVRFLLVRMGELGIIDL